MLATFVAIALAAGTINPPKQPQFGLNRLQRVLNLRGANEILVRPEAYREMIPQWVRLYGVDVPNYSRRGYSGARQDLEILLGREAEVYVQDEDPKHPISRNATEVQYMWAWGKLLEYELVNDGWAKVNDEGRKGRYATYLIAAENAAKKAHAGIWQP